MKHFYIFRHGQTNMNLIHRYQGQLLNEGLNEKGLRQAKILAERLQDVGLEAVFSSPLKRAYQTAEIICQSQKIPLFTEDGLTECCHGVADGMDVKDIIQTYPDIYEKWVDYGNPAYTDVCFERGESRRDIIERVLKVFHKLLKVPYGTIGIATHSMVMRCLLLYFNLPIPEIKNADIYLMSYEKGNFKLESLVKPDNQVDTDSD